MASSTRLRSSTAPSPGSADGNLEDDLQRLILSLQGSSSQETDSVRLVNQWSHSLQQIRHILLDDRRSTGKEVFRRLNGFEALTRILDAVAGPHGPSGLPKSGKSSCFDLIKAILAVLAEALEGHSGNRRYFSEQLEGRGWTRLERSLSAVRAAVADQDPDSIDVRGCELLFGSLFAFALKDDSVESKLEGLRRFLAQDQQRDGPARTAAEAPAATDASVPLPEHEASKHAVADTHLEDTVKAEVQRAFKLPTLLRNPEILPTICRFWLTSFKPSTAQNTANLSWSILLVLQEIIVSSKFNVSAACSTDLMSILLPYVYRDLEVTKEVSILRHIAEILVQQGLPRMRDAYSLYREAMTSPQAADFLLEAIRSSRGPAHVHFDMSLHGFSSIEIPTLGRSFPPPSSSAGYSFAAWIYIDQFDANLHTTIFGASDHSQTCFVMAYIEKDTHNLIVQTSIKSSKPSVRFKSKVFQARRWYHVVIVHSRPRTTSSSKAALFVDGELVEQLQCHYPASPPLLNSSTESFASLSASPKRHHPVRAFLGTPHDLSSRIGQGLTSSRWSLASFHLFEEALSRDLIAVYYRLGPRYYGNFQDCLGSFQTYEASAALSLRNEILYVGKAESSTLVSAFRSKAGNILPESRIIFSVFPSAVLATDGKSDPKESTLIKSLSRRATGKLYQLTRYGGNAVVINGAVPSVNVALSQSHGVGILSGEPVVLHPASLDETSWRLGGCAAVGLKLVEIAETRESVVRAVEILLESMKESWRNSEAMEKENAFGILGLLLSKKMGMSPVALAKESPLVIKGGIAECQKLSFELLSVLVGFVGLKHARREESVLVNSLAYRTLLVDLDLWRRAAPMTQKLYYDQFVVFGVDSKYHQFNSKRLFRMRIAKRFLDSLKNESVDRSLVPEFRKAFLALLKMGASGEMFRTLSLFVTYALSRGRRSEPVTPHPDVRHSRVPSSLSGAQQKGDLQLTGADTGPSDAKDTLSYTELATLILDIYAELLCATTEEANIKKFARAVTNKWLLQLLGDDDADVVALGLRILVRLLVSQGNSYINKFATKTNGFTIMKRQLVRWWRAPCVWSLLFGMLFGSDFSDLSGQLPGLDMARQRFVGNGEAKILYPEILPVLMSVLAAGLRAEFNEQRHGNAVGIGTRNGTITVAAQSKQAEGDSSPILSRTAGSRKSQDHVQEHKSSTIEDVLHILADLHTKNEAFRTFAVSSDYVKEILSLLYSVILSTDSVSAERELHLRDSSWSRGSRESQYPRKRGFSVPADPIGNAATASSRSKTQRPRPKERASSFILISSDPAGSLSATSEKSFLQFQNPSIDSLRPLSRAGSMLLKLLMQTFLDQVFARKEFTGFGIYTKIPPGMPEHVASFESFILQTVVLRIRERISSEHDILSEPRIINNMAFIISHLGEAMLEGWLASGADITIDFAGTVIECLQKPDMVKKKTVRLCSQAILSMKSVFFKAVLCRLSDPDPQDTEGQGPVSFLNRVLYWQNIIFDVETAKSDYLRLLWYLLYTKLVDPREKVKVAAANFGRIMLMQKPSAISAVFSHAMSASDRELISSFERLKEMDDDSFLGWVVNHRSRLDAVFSDTFATAWEDFIRTENKRIEVIAASRNNARKEKLKQWQVDDGSVEAILHNHEMTCYHMAVNIYAAERLKHQRAMQDQQDNANFLMSTFKRLELNLKGPCPLIETGPTLKWRLDQTEGRNRMRVRTLPDSNSSNQEYHPKGTQPQSTPGGRQRSNTRSNTPSSYSAPESKGPRLGRIVADEDQLGAADPKTPETAEFSTILGDEFEMVDDPRGDGDNFEDKNRTVIRSLQRGDQIQHVYNVSRVVGLEAYEGLLVLGKDCLYLLDDFFQRSDGEIVGVSQAPKDERDPYVQMISGRQSDDSRPSRLGHQRGSRQWRWTEVISFSRRRFLFRDVAIEVFFTDGRSYLLTSISPATRNELYLKLTEKAPHVHGSTPLTLPEDRWRLEALRSAEEDSHSIGSKIANVFTSGQSYSATRRWVRGEISNFHYLMLVNTMAGRTFNDLTQYPVFPWVLADYSSEELDLTKPGTFRDLAKPMGAQNAQRQADFDARYQAFAEMGDHNAPPFHYGTHYSSAMIVTSYLVRLQPFVQSFLLLQGGSFDHADRMFHSIEQAWMSASRELMTDVRELIPEFFYLPEFLENLNGYNFGLRQKTGEAIDAVALPPWAKGDPKIFIAKHREALESEHVSRHLHQWIDLVFGCKQQGEAAVKATNVFHHLSYHGAKDLDTIEDPVERLATIGIIHNFGQTPHQVFQRPHPAREVVRHKRKTLETMAERLTRLAQPLLETGDRVSSLMYSQKQDRLLCSGPFRFNIPPDHDKCMEWGFVDDSVRFYQAEGRKLVGLFEHMHQRQVTCALFADSKTLITAGLDCTIAIWALTMTPKAVDLQPKTTLFGHMAPVTVLATSRSYSALLSVSADGQASLWDLNRMLFVRNLPSTERVECARINDVNGDIVLCHQQSVAMYTLNGQHILTQQVCSEDEDDDTDNDDCISSCAFYEGVGNEWLERELLFTGHKRGVVKIWNKTISGSGKFQLELVRRLDHINIPSAVLSMSSSSPSSTTTKHHSRSQPSPSNQHARRSSQHHHPQQQQQHHHHISSPSPSTTTTTSERLQSNNIAAGITCILPMPNRVYTGDEDGRVYEWNCAPLAG